jgi:hypothetical protein
LAATKVRVGFRIGIGSPVRRAPGRLYYAGMHHYRFNRPLYWGPRVYEVRRVNYGEVDFNIKPDDSKIYIDGRYLGIADDFNGYPQTAKLPGGYYNVRVVAPSGAVEKRRIYVAVGQEYNFNYKFK